MTIWGALTELGKAFNAVFTWVTGGKTREEQRIDREVSELEEEWHAAENTDQLNRARARLRRLRERVAASRQR